MHAANHSGVLPATRRQTLTLAGGFIVTTLFYVVAFPKGGIKAGGVPLTFGYMLSAVMMLVAVARTRHASVHLDRTVCLLPCLLLSLWSALVVNANGTDSIGYTTSYFISVMYLPLFGLIFFSSLVLDDYNDRIEKTLVWAVRFIVVYGIFLFLFKQVTGRWIEIPYLTVNAADAGSLDDKNINRGGIFKLISTYNNGNIFGISVAILGPLYLANERRLLLRGAFYLAMLLTLSRTVWIGLLLIVMLRSLSRGIKPLTILYMAAGMLLAFVGIYFVLSSLGLDASFLFDSNLGGRAGQLDVLEDMRIIPNIQTSAIPEIAYLGILKYFGLPGFALFICYLLTPPMLLWLEGVPVLSTAHASACMQGMLIYAVIAWADAAFSYIPVMMVFWMIAGWGFWYAHRQTRPVRIVHASPR